MQRGNNNMKKALRFVIKAMMAVVVIYSIKVAVIDMWDCYLAADMWDAAKNCWTMI
jgi:hypothetical protein